MNSAQKNEKVANDCPMVVVQGLGFVGSAVAAAVAEAKDAEGRHLYRVVGVDLPTDEGKRKIELINQGKIPFACPDEALKAAVREAVLHRRNLQATSDEAIYAQADFIIMDVHLDAERTAAVRQDIRLNVKPIEAAARSVGARMKPEALLLVETTVPFGACERIIAPILHEERKKRGIGEPLLLAHAYERVMPGPRYLDSILRFWRVFSGINPESATAARSFLSTFIDTEKFPLSELESPASSELGKLLENSYRAANIAFIHEWTILAERTGVDLWRVIDAIRVRKGTHDNMRYPGFGVGGYCLTKDSYLAQWSLQNLFGDSHRLDITIGSMEINQKMPLHTLDLVSELVGGSLTGMRVLVCGVSYLADVGDTRNSPTATFVRAAEAAGAKVTVHDPCIEKWQEQPEVSLIKKWPVALGNFDAVVFAVPHQEYRSVSASWFAAGTSVIDASNVLDDAVAAELHTGGCIVAGVGKGHWRRKGWHIRPECKN